MKTFLEMLKESPMLVEIPDEIREKLELERGVQICHNELRAELRFRCNDRCLIAPIDRSPPSGLGEEHGTFGLRANRDSYSIAVVRDVARGSLGLYVHQGWSQGEKLVVVNEHLQLFGSVARCREIGPSCYDIGVILEPVR